MMQPTLPSSGEASARAPLTRVSQAAVVALAGLMLSGCATFGLSKPPAPSAPVPLVCPASLTAEIANRTALGSSADRDARSAVETLLRTSLLQIEQHKMTLAEFRTLLGLS